MRITKKRALKYSGFFAAGVAAVLIAAAAVSAVSSDERSANAIDPAPKDGHLRETFTRELQLPEGASVKIRNESGSISVAGWDSDKVSIAVDKRLIVLGLRFGSLKARFGMPIGIPEEERTSFNALDLDVRLTGGALIIRSTRQDFAPNAGLSFHIDIKVPRSTDLDVHAKNGPIAIRDIDGQVRVETENGPLTCDTITGSLTARSHNGAISCRAIEGDLIANASNGPIEIDKCGADPAHTIRCETGNGAIRLNLPQTASFDLAATTANGYIKTDLEVDGEAPSGHMRSVTGTIGTGGPLIELRTLNGSIYLDES